jgi:hypothetical protein
MLPSGIYYPALVGLSLGTFAPPSLLSQSSDNTVTLELSALKPSKAVRLHTSADGRVEGRLVSVGSDSVVLLDAGKRRALPIAGLDSVWTRRRHAGHGAMILGAVGLGLGLIAGFANKGGCESSDLCSAAPLILGGGGLVAGGLIGLGVGSAIRSYTLKAPRTRGDSAAAAARSVRPR